MPPSKPVPALAACARPRRHPEILTHCPRTRHVVDISRPQVAWLTRFISLAASASPTPAAYSVDALISLVSAATLAASISASLPATTITSTSSLSPGAYVVPTQGAPLHQPQRAASPATALATAFVSTVRLTPTAAISSVSCPSPAAPAAFSPPTRKRLVVRTDLLAAHSVRPHVTVRSTHTPSLWTARSCAESVHRCPSATLPHAMPMCQTRVPDPV